jgi:mRNA interferase RelE/StbE
MAAYKVYFKESVEKDFAAILKKELVKILHRIKALSGNTRPTGCEKLTGHERYRVREGRYRSLYSIQYEVLTVWIVKISEYRCADKKNK